MMMALFSHRHVIILFLFFILTTTTAAAVEEDELDSVLTVLRARGYILFSNAIATSDLVYEIINSQNSSSSFTFFAPPDSSLFALDMTLTASDYALALRCHIIPFRLSLNDLRRFNPRYAVRTLLKNHQIRIENHRFSNNESVISVDGVRVVSPGLFYSRQIAIHGLRGVLSCLRSRRVYIPARAPHAPPPMKFLNDHSVFPPAEETEPPAPSGYSPAFSPESIVFSPVTGIPTASTPVPDLPGNDGPTAFSPERLDEEEREIIFVNSISPADLTAIMETEL